ncbi:ELWxxDGT repeat protein [Stieleria maiorica]|uniref:ELWxxDGT repeat protein n=1 Tax=Stieleria maiorica TaxID=2795974 RepID=UPI00142F2C1A|nr:ELWxxDGT repeat protein [Stieleria maiorica]
MAAPLGSLRSDERKHSDAKRDRALLRRSRRRRLGAAIESLERRELLTFAIDLFQDINTLGVSSGIEQVVRLGDESFFVADDGKHGAELWKTDGTVDGTVMVKDLLPGPDASVPADLTVLGNELYFTALDENDETDLWKTDGTESGTVKVYDADASGVYYLTDLTASGTKLFFTAYEPATGYELWVHDGTSGGTALVKDINPDQFVIDRPQELTDVNGTLFFTSYDDGYYNRELWKSDGTAEGTMMVADLGIDPGIDPGPADDDPTFSSNPTFLTNHNGLLFFAAEDYVDGVELYKSDGTESGTVRVADLNPVGSSYPEELTSFNGELFFAASDGTGGRHLFKSDGSTITLVADTTKGLGSSVPIGLEVMGEELFFAASGAVPATRISVSSPTMTADNSRVVNGNYAGIVAETITAYGGTLSGFNASITFNSTAQGGSNNNLGWVSSGARIGDAGVGLQSIEVGDLYVEDIDEGELVVNAWEWTLSDPAGLANLSFSGFASGNELTTSTPGDAEGLLFELFLNGSSTPTSSTTVSGPELDNWYLGRDADNVNLSDPGGASVTTATVRLSIGNSMFANYPDGGNEAFVVGATFSADLSSETTQVVDAGRELHKTNGTPQGTVMVKDIVPMGSSNPSDLTQAGGKLYFAADDVFNDGLELWMSDGTAEGTMQVVDSLPGNDLYGAPLDGAPRLLGEVDGQLIFTATDVARDRELWITDGDPLGTEVLVNINPSTQDADVRDLVLFGTDLFFVADDGINGEAIWKADTVAGTVELYEDISPSSTDRISTLTVYSALTEQIVFYNNSLGTAGGVYLTDPNGPTRQLSDRRPVELDENGTMFVIANGWIYFVADDGVSGNELWKTDGSGPAEMVWDLIPGSAGSNPMELVALESFLYFSADTSSETVTAGVNMKDIGRELFRTDGTAVSLVMDINGVVDPNDMNRTFDSSPEDLTVVGNELFFTADNGVNGRELWRRDSLGTTHLVADLRSGGNGSNPTALADVSGTLYFSADNGADGFEPYRSDGTGIGTYQIANINPGNADSDPGGFFPALGEVYFSADDGGSGEELWKTTGAAGNATLVSDIQSGGGSQPVPLYDTGNRLLLSAAGTINNDRELWSTDGSEALTLLVEDLYPPELFGSDPDEIIEIGGKLYFVAENGPFGRELFTLQEVSPAVVDVIVGGQAGAAVEHLQRSTVDQVTVVFDGNVDVPAGAVQLVNRDTNTSLTSLIIDRRFESGQTFVEVTFGSGPSVVDRDPNGTTGLRNSLADGNYQLTILSGLVSSPVSGVAMAADFHYGAAEADRFFRHFGDTDGDRDVDGQDYGRFGQTFLQPLGASAFNETLDFEGDGDVDGQDYGRFGQRFLTRLDFS